jgi:hypothetical protein
VIRRHDSERSVVRRLSALTAIAAAAFLSIAGPAIAKPSPNPEEHPFEIAAGSFHIIPSTTTAGAHEDLTTSFDFAQNSQHQTYDDVRSTVVELPAGFIGSNTAVPTCTTSQLLLGAEIQLGGRPTGCPLGSVVGQISLDFGSSGLEQRLTLPLYNMENNSFGIAAKLGFIVYTATQVLAIRVRAGDSGLTITAPEIENLGEPRNISVTIWGVPAAHEHDLARQQQCTTSSNAGCVNTLGGPVSAGVPIRPFLSNPTSCGSFTAHLAADSWEHPDQWSEQSVEVGPITGCERVPFDPSIEVAPTTRAVESSSGLDISLVVPQAWDNPFVTAASNLKGAKVTLPVGYTANPSLASGLGVCTPAQFEAETSSSPPGAGCPPESKIGTVDVETPVLVENHLEGNIYIAKPFENPFGTLLGLYIVVKDPQRGIIVKLAGKIEPNLVTGQLVTTFDNNPQVPFSRFTLKLSQGANSPLVSPPVCGSYTAESDLTPWSDPLVPRLVTSSFQIENGIGGGPCPAGGVPPFHPGLVAGTLNNSAGAYSPMDIHITRNDGEQEITRFSSILPPGLTASLRGVPFCPEANIEAAKHVTGAQEETAPSCPASSEIGHSLVGAGVGTVLAYTPGKVYMAGPYNGAPFSIAAITSAKVGPFDLGTVVVREALVINPETAVVTVDAKASDPIPHIIDGIVIHVRDIRVYIDRSQFMINPTNCDPLSFAATVTGAGADPANPADQAPVTINNSFQMANCQNLQFKPVFKVSTSGKTSRSKGASLSVKLAYPKAPQGTQANIKSVKVDLPKQLPSRLTTLQKACPDSTFNANPAACPAASIVGHATAITPILPVPLTGPAYFVSHGGAKFPELIVVLQGYGVTLDLHGETFISKAGITSSTFRTVPDDPIGNFELTLPQGPYSALAANGNLCKSKLAMPTAFTAQNGAVIHQSTKISVTGCAKAKKAAKHRKRKSKKKGKRK